MPRHYIIHSADEDFQQNIHGGFIGPLIAAAAGFLLPKVLGMGVSEVDEDGNSEVIVNEIPKITKRELTKMFKDAIEASSSQNGQGAIGLGGSGAIGLGAGIIASGAKPRIRAAKKKFASGEKRLTTSPLKQTVFHL